MDNQLIASLVLERLFTRQIRLEFRREELLGLLQDVHFVIRSGIYHHHDGHILFDK